jgi:hypothetical protein
MVMNQLQAEADKRGFLVYALTQANTAPLAADAKGNRAPGPWGALGSVPNDGYCAGLATRWIALRYAAYDFPFNRTTKICQSPDWQSTRDQHIVVEEWNDPSKRFPTQFKAAYAQYGLQLNLGAVIDFPTAMNGVILRRVGQAAKGCHCIYIEGTGGAHAVAMMNEGSMGWRFFDANHGHFRLPSAAAFQEFIDWFMDRSGYTQNQLLSQQVATVHINPPPYTGAAFDSVMKLLTRRLDR